MVHTYALFLLLLLVAVLIVGHSSPVFPQLKNGKAAAGNVQLALTCFHQPSKKENGEEKEWAADPESGDQNLPEGASETDGVGERKRKKIEEEQAPRLVRLRVSQMKAIDLKDVEWVGKMDPYLKLSLVSSAGSSSKQFQQRTKEITDGGRSINWSKEIIDFQVGMYVYMKMVNINGHVLCTYDSTKFARTHRCHRPC